MFICGEYIHTAWQHPGWMFLDIIAVLRPMNENHDFVNQTVSPLALVFAMGICGAMNAVIMRFTQLHCV